MMGTDKTHYDQPTVCNKVYQYTLIEQSDFLLNCVYQLINSSYTRADRGILLFPYNDKLMGACYIVK